MLDSSRNDDELALFQQYGLIAKLDAKTSFHHQKQFIFVFMMVPNELTFELGQFDQLTIEFARDVGFPVLGNVGELVSEIDLLHGAP